MSHFLFTKRRVKGQIVTVIQNADGTFTPNSGGKFKTQHDAEQAEIKARREQGKEDDAKSRDYARHRERIEAKYVRCDVCNKSVPNRETHERSADHKNNVAIRDAKIRGDYAGG